MLRSTMRQRLRMLSIRGFGLYLRRWKLILGIILIYSFVFNIWIVNLRLNNHYLHRRMMFYAQVILMLESEDCRAMLATVDAYARENRLALSAGGASPGINPFKDPSVLESACSGHQTVPGRRGTAELVSLSKYLRLFTDDVAPSQADLKEANFLAFGVMPRFDAKATPGELYTNASDFVRYRNCADDSWIQRDCKTGATSWYYTLMPWKLVEFYDYKCGEILIAFAVTLLAASVAVTFLSPQDLDAREAPSSVCPGAILSIVVLSVVSSYIFTLYEYRELESEWWFNFPALVYGQSMGYIAIYLLASLLYRGYLTRDGQELGTLEQTRTLLFRVATGALSLGIGAIWPLFYLLNEAGQEGGDETFRTMTSLICVSSILLLAIVVLGRLLVVRCARSDGTTTSLWEFWRMGKNLEAAVVILFGALIFYALRLSCN